MSRRAAVEIDPGAVTANARALVDLAGGAELCAVVKADGYGHGATEVARSAVAGGATWLAVALVGEGRQLREAGLEVPILVLSEPPVEAMAEACAARLTPTVYTRDGVEAAAKAAEAAGGPWSVHLKVDTGMHRVGADPSDAVDLAGLIVARSELRLGGTFTHLAVADEPDRPETALQLDRFAAVLERLARAGIDPGLRHAANSAGHIAHPESRLDLVRVGIALYGIAPAPALEGMVGLRPAMSVRSAVSFVRSIDAGEGVSYGLRHVVDRPSRLAVVPLGYADGVSRRLFETGGEVLIGGVRRPIRGVVTMDQFVVEVTDGPEVRPGDEVVLIGSQGDERITAQEWADRLGTIAYEVVCGFGPRIPRRYAGATIDEP
jgi:alanine racemase